MRVRNMHKTIKGTKRRRLALQRDGAGRLRVGARHAGPLGLRGLPRVRRAHDVPREGGVLARVAGRGPPDRRPRTATCPRPPPGFEEYFDSVVDDRAGVDPGDPRRCWRPSAPRRHPTCPACTRRCGGCCARPWAASCGWPPSGLMPDRLRARLELPFSAAERRTFAAMSAALARRRARHPRPAGASSAPTTCAGATRPWTAATWPPPARRRPRRSRRPSPPPAPAARRGSAGPTRRPCRRSQCHAAGRVHGGPPVGQVVHHLGHAPARRPSAPAPPRPPPAPRAPGPWR